MSFPTIPNFISLKISFILSGISRIQENQVHDDLVYHKTGGVSIVFEFFGAGCCNPKNDFLTGCGIPLANPFQSFFIYGADDCVKGKHVV